MGEIIALVNSIQTILCGSEYELIDPFPTEFTRSGKHFFTETDGINFTRKDTFPKGYIEYGGEGQTVSSSLGRSGRALNSAIITIHYYVKEKDIYTTEGNLKYMNQDLVTFMLQGVRTCLLNNRITGYHLNSSSFGTITKPEPINTGTFKLYWGTMDITYYWEESYGTN